ncbi:MAG: DUF4391 domain-containing protein [Prevotellaceae bacterium]|nr:DUF4391 domain-containing protein [Prevotellaceae bacterium]
MLRRIVSKVAFYRKLTVGSRIRQHFVDDLVSLTWIYKLAPSVLNVEKGEDVEEIVVFLALLKNKEYHKDVFQLIDKQLPRHVLFLLRYEEEYCLLLNYKERMAARGGNKFRILQTFASEWMRADALRLPLQGQTMDLVYENLAGFVSGYGTAAREDMKRMIELAAERQKKSRQLEAKRRKMSSERQVNRQQELYSEVRQLSEEVNILCEKMAQYQRQH